MVGHGLDLVFEGANRVLMLGNGLGVGLDVLLLVTNRRLETNTLALLVANGVLKETNHAVCASVQTSLDILIRLRELFFCTASLQCSTVLL